MGQAKRRANEIRTLKASSNLKAAVVHECGHVIATLHFDVPIGDGGVWLREHDGNVIGFNDARSTEKHGSLYMGELIENRRFFFEYEVMNYAGPFAEFFFVTGNRDPVSVFERQSRHWLNDFAVAMGARGIKNSGMVTFSREQFGNAEQLARRCFVLLVGDVSEIPPVWCGDKDIAALVKDCVLATGKLLRAHWQQILDLSDVLLTSPSLAMTKIQLDKWARANFIRQCSCVDNFTSPP